MANISMGTRELPSDTVPNEEKQQTIIENYLILKGNTISDQEINKFYAFQPPNLTITKPSISVWEFMTEKELDSFLKLSKRSAIRERIASKLDQDYPIGNPRSLYIELMFNTTMFCKNRGLSLEKSAAILSQFHLTHIYFTSNFNVSAEKAYFYFKELVMTHSLPFVPENTKIFSHSETKEIMEFFCKLYLSFLPLIRFLSLPNFAFYLDYTIEPEADLKEPANKSKKGKGKNKEKGTKGKSKKSKSSKTGKSK